MEANHTNLEEMNSEVEDTPAQDEENKNSTENSTKGETSNIIKVSTVNWEIVTKDNAEETNETTDNTENGNHAKKTTFSDNKKQNKQEENKSHCKLSNTRQPN
eukprot:12860787-Ditylum_brightwellii.AAC.1